MGLDVYAVTEWEALSISEEEYLNKGDKDFRKFYHNPHFKEHSEEITETYYEVLDIEGDFCMSYGGYSSFRDFLAKLAGYHTIVEEPSYDDPDYSNKSYYHRFPHVAGIYTDENVTMESDFVALIHFSDCEGQISNKWCKVLDKAFDKYAEKVETLRDDYYQKKYFDMAECVKAAANTEKGFLYFE